MKEKMSVSGGRRLSLPPLRVGERQPHKLGCQTSEVRSSLTRVGCSGHRSLEQSNVLTCVSIDVNVTLCRHTHTRCRLFLKSNVLTVPRNPKNISPMNALVL